MQLFDARIACPCGVRLDGSFYRSILKTQVATNCYALQSNTSYFYLVSPKGTNFALLDIETSRVLKTLQDIQLIRYEAVLPLSPLDKRATQVNGQSRNEICEASINIYGSIHSAVQAGAILTEQRQYLQHPLLLEFGIEYVNPHFFTRPGSRPNLNSYVEKRYYGPSAQKRISSATAQLLDSLDFVEIKSALPVINALQTPLLRSVPIYSVTKSKAEQLLSVATRKMH